MQSEMTVAISRLQAQIANLQGLANLCRLAVIGHPRSFQKVVDEMQCLQGEFLRDDSEVLNCTCKGMSDCHTRGDDRVSFASVLDLFAGASFVCKDQPKERDAYICSLVGAVEAAIAFPVMYAEEH